MSDPAERPAVRRLEIDRVRLVHFAEIEPVKDRELGLVGYARTLSIHDAETLALEVALVSEYPQALLRPGEAFAGVNAEASPPRDLGDPEGLRRALGDARYVARLLDRLPIEDLVAVASRRTDLHGHLRMLVALRAARRELREIE